MGDSWNQFKKTTVDLAVEKLTEYICSDSVSIGDKLPSEVALCKQLNISRTTVREAYRVLQSQGYLDIQTGKGAFVQNKEQSFIQNALGWITSHKLQMSDYLVVRMALDPLSAKLAAECAEQKEIDALCSIHKEFMDSVHKKDNDNMARLDALFHEHITIMTHNDLLIVMVHIVNHYFKILRECSFYSTIGGLFMQCPFSLVLFTPFLMTVLELSWKKQDTVLRILSPAKNCRLW